jgi:hypothetical protein
MRKPWQMTRVEWIKMGCPVENLQWAPIKIKQFGEVCGTLVSVRPCGEEYGNKTYLGIMLGDLPLDVQVMHNSKTGELEILNYNNPAIFVPDLKQIIWGCGSWWGVIENEEQLRQISDDDIQNVWYVKALKAMQKTKDNPSPAQV